ncbi:beta-lactamase domain protein [Methylorubrum populi BJ001]|jgi:ribonuclease BN (tRNA processing enzyme)|uniref:Beta-lactamase domain protein n=1 Tax=Methylorubrum populi (strain ATCC BAA-705 / NCIMB 13946 / BJ001) TaxID=441620 RepID=B1ZKC0_METPB|nr:MBL fold metallo-hydrolase [Methylorubrum populi]ACB80112.1 beta-lactamase domain protein [Methylorubrum populi BJ001]OAH17108.1 MBL fold metallo-hydrolase [Methylorubrum populi]PZP68465.1 MAG: MBL fold metallo-hydrolase [Methylorubrum populi]
MRLQVLGCGDAFGSGGRFNTCFHVDPSAGGDGDAFLIDCGASSLIAIRRFGVDPNRIRSVFLTHLHGDHFGGLPWLILDGQLVSGRTRPLTVVGPPGTAERLPAAMEVLFPGSSTAECRFAVEVVEIEAGRPVEVAGVTAAAFAMRHPSGAPAHALRIESAGRVVSYTGDTEWVEDIVAAGRGADLMIAEGYTVERPVKFHLDWATLKRRLPEIGPKRLILTHMSPEMIAHPPDGYIAAEDGLVVAL